MKQQNKPRLYLALCARNDAFRNESNCDHYYHWALLIGPDSALRKTLGTRYHVRHTAGRNGARTWFYEEEQMNKSSPPTQMVLVRIALAKVVAPSELEKRLRSMSVNEYHRHDSSGSDSDQDTAWTCRSWVKAAVQNLLADSKVLKGYIGPKDWPAIEACARRYIQHKREQRRFQESDGTWNPATVATWNYWENRETSQ